MYCKLCLFSVVLADDNVIVLLVDLAHFDVIWPIFINSLVT